MMQIKRATVEEIPSIMEFINKFWKKDHILACDRNFFEWMYGRENEINFNIALDSHTGELFGINGFVRYNSEDHPDISGALWKARKSAQSPLLGLDMGKYLKDKIKFRYNFSVGVSERASKLEKLCGNEVSELKRYYLLNQLPIYHIAKVAYIPVSCPNIVDSKFICIKDIAEFQEWITEEDLRNIIPFKDYHYINHRYFEHPVYKYYMLGLSANNQKTHGVFVGREVEVNNSRILKIVDFFGRDEEIKNAYCALRGLMKKREYEYIDFYEYGIADDLLEKAGFSLLRDDTNIIPNYFEPFEQCNVTINIVLCKGENLHIYRGDADQDRPNTVKKVGLL